MSIQAPSLRILRSLWSNSEPCTARDTPPSLSHIRSTRGGGAGSCVGQHVAGVGQRAALQAQAAAADAVGRLSRRRCRCTMRSSRSWRQPADSRAQSLLVGHAVGRQRGERVAHPRERDAEALGHPDEGDAAQGLAACSGAGCPRCGGC